MTILHKRGATFSYVASLANMVFRDGTLVSDFAGWTARSQVRDALTREKVADLATELVPPAGSVPDYTLVLEATDTSAWPCTTLMLDVELVAPDGVRVISGSAAFDVIEPETVPA